MNQHAAPPEFAMSFTQEAVRLECRNGPDWRPLGHARFAGGDMAAVLNGLREQAGGQAGELDTVLVIPDDQILYTVLTIPFGSDTAATIARALESSTPYRADDLAFDWCPAENGDIETLRVAAVARRTLHEAEDFARAQGFRPSGFQARPGDDRFQGNPDFGPSRLVQEQYNRRPFSEPVLSQARVTAPQIEVEQAAVAVVPVISRIIPHVVSVPVAAPLAVAATDIIADDAAPQTADAPAAVIRHGTGPLTAQRLSPRAEAVHSRAAAARTQRDSAVPDEAAAPQLVERLRSLDPARLPVLVGGLALLLVMALLFLGRPAPQEDLAEAPVQQTPVEAQPQQAAPAPQAAIPVAPEPAAPATVEPAPVTPEPQTAQTTPEPTEQPDALDQALAEALAQARAPAAQAPATAPVAVPPAASMVGDLAVAPAAPAAEVTPPVETATPAAPPAAPATAAPTATPPAQSPTAAAQAEQLARSARPPRATPAAASAPAAPDRQPTVPANPLPFAVQNQPAAPVAAARPPSRPAAAPVAQTAPAPVPASRPAATPAPAASAPAQTTAAPAARPPSPAPARPAAEPARPAAEAATAPAPAQPSARPPSRPDQLSLLEEGSALDQPVALTQAERDLITRQLRDLRTAQAGDAPLTRAERGLVFQLADARPTRRPVAVRAPSQQAVQDAVAQAVDAARPAPRASAAASLAAPRPAAVDAGPTAAPSGAISRSARPNSRPGTRAVASPAASDSAVEDAIASAIGNSPAAPGAVALTALTSSAIPPRRVGGAAVNSMVATAAPVAAALSPSSPDLRAAAEAQSAEAAMADQRRQDAELQAQAEARARSQAAADAQAEAQARAQAEARARAQAQAEAQAAASRNQRYQPPEVDSEPEVVAAVPQNAIGNAAASATVKDGIELRSTQIIGTIGAGRASRALVRLSNGRVLTLRIGDRINGGTISEIGDSRITYQKQGRAHALGVLNGQ